MKCGQYVAELCCDFAECNREETRMGEIVNLNKFRKKREREERQAESANNSARSGRSKADRAVTAQDAGRERADLDGKRMNPNEDENPCESDTPPEQA